MSEYPVASDSAAIDSVNLTQALAEQADPGQSVYLVPAFTGLGAPYWDQDARGVIVGLTRGANRDHVVRAGLESIAYQTRDVLNAMEADSGIRLTELRVDGGASMKFRASAEF